MKLKEATECVIEQFGVTTLKSDRFFNLLDDFGGFREVPISSKIIIREILEAGLGLLLHDLIEKRNRTTKSSVNKFIFNYLNKTSYRIEEQFHCFKI